ncbi:MAG: Phosphate regulon sensor protein PhoR (SphS) [uncultured Thermomicrobiales bacterium]|uniref:histidine kinase n=1 Tax=uncultured Thermomicrobiales bacterium TaxID=1645740 RepID=A0A6J4UDZ5_9BACT|nr:MAG: Phosphate regulon sensor protein PhoR (SphS) [uncultured Thermomicrobiales bacterium]
MTAIGDLVHSVRFRLTVWYGSLMVVFMLLAGFGGWTLMGTWLRSDLDDQLRASAQTYSDPATLTDVFRDTTTVADRGASGPVEGKAGSDKYQSLIVQVTDGTGYTPITPFDCAIPYSLPADAPTGTIKFSTQTACGDTFRVLAVSEIFVDLRTNDVNTLVLAQSLTPITDTLETLRELLLAIGALGILLALQGGWLIAGRALRPISSVTETASTIAESPRTDRSLAGRLPVPRGNDEVAQLTMTFNRMLDRVEGEFGRRQRFVADASHELRTPLAAIRGNLDVLSMQLQRRPAGSAGADAVDDPARQESIAEGFADLDREARRMARLLDDLLFLARADDQHAPVASPVQPVQLDTLVEQTVRAATGLASGQRLETSVVPVTVTGDRDRLAQVLWVLLDNALRHTGPGHRILVSVDREDTTAVVSVHDEGSGIAPEDLPHVFDRFYRADGARSRDSGGSGLGLSIARTIVEQHGGGITASSVPDEGTTFTVRLPAA